MTLSKDFLSIFDAELSKVTTEKGLNELKIKYLGRKNGILTTELEKLAVMPLADKQQHGPVLSTAKSHIYSAIEAKLETLLSTRESIDFSLPAIKPETGHLHPITRVSRELEMIFHSMGFQTILTQEVESDWHNFTALNIPEHHPARDMQDTFYIDNQSLGNNEGSTVLRTQTSSGQIRFMKENKPPFSIIIPGRVYRNEATDATHEHTFDQMEGLVVGKGINLANMVWVLNTVLGKFFGNEVRTKLLPSYFPFVEPGCEVAISHPDFRGGKWLEILGCGMVHQKVFTAVGYEKNEYQGFAFGFGLTRFALMKYGITDIRLLAENNIEFLKQF